MFFEAKTSVLAVCLLIASPAGAWAFGGIGCADLPEYDRATGALEGMTGACDMTLEEARRIHAAHDGTLAEPVARVRHGRHRQERARSPQS